MPRFNYKVRSANGELITGVVTASNLQEAGQNLRSEGKFVVEITPARDRDAGSVDEGQTPRKRGRIKRTDVITFAHQVAVMVDTGVPLSEALHCIGEQITNEHFKTVVDDVGERVNAGSDFSSSLARHPKVFPSVMISLMKASEASGTMGVMLDRVSTYMSKELAILKKVRGALMYPAFMFMMLIAVTVFLLTFVLPKFSAIYGSRGSALPVPTRLLMAISNTFIYHWYWVLAVIVAAVVGYMLLLRTTVGRHVMDSAKLHAPIIGPMMNKLYITRATRTMGTMIASGVPILDMVAIARNVTHNHLYEQLWDDVDDKLKHGSQLSDALFDSPLIPRNVSQMIYSGEKSGRLGSVMEKIANFTEADFEEQVKVTTQFIEPLMVAAMGIIVGFVAIALLLPIFTIGKVVSGG